eukprot:scaffold10902_cov188-Amphora_coffeaeformis.AAC.1
MFEAIKEPEYDDDCLDTNTGKEELPEVTWKSLDMSEDFYQAPFVYKQTEENPKKARKYLLQKKRMEDRLKAAMIIKEKEEDIACPVIETEASMLSKQTSTNIGRDIWIADTGATCHMTNQIEGLYDIKP